MSTTSSECRGHHESNPEPGNLRRQKDGRVSRSQREIVLLAIACKVIKPELHHCYVQQVGSADGLRQAVLVGELVGRIEYLVVIHINEAYLASLGVLLKKR